MADNLYLTEEAAPDTPEAAEKLIKIIIIVAIICLSSALIWLFGVSPFRPFNRIDIVSYDVVAREKVLEVAGITRNSSYFSTDSRTVERSLMNISSIESARVSKRFPDRLHIVIENRRPVASALATLNGLTVPVLFDSRGVIFQIGRDEISPSSALPIISGLVIEEPFPGMRLPPLFIPFFEELEKIEMSSPMLLQAVSEIRIDLRPFNNYDLILYPVHRRIKVRLSELNEDLLRYALLMVDVLSSRENEIDTIDFRSGIASYIPKEASL
ncbi:MAG: FtsQ-type POTRA domain-containing protein [Treponema sp.]|nr:FtsQ-type POTRA domain-containing protein [Treponema sp.]